ncbi:hypothetical protein GJ699_06105 [Duganella sp. FT80W]|uniref:DUF1439 domain-containing protein n=1 Tax=Duganella guangzhouensis TaxID=2666084 RepID=A0A6I2KVK9_9BURK|nr:hypothetical protein [Duganella guangzhouensis]MRW89552.1 hypothetical protein [Duganella guangzhouensis]
MNKLRTILSARRGRFGLVGIAFFLISQSAFPAEIILEETAVLKLLKQALFTGPEGRMYLASGVCYTYLEEPSVKLSSGRLFLSGHLSSRSGIVVGKDCLGVGLASDFTVSGKPAFRGNILLIEDLRVDRVEDKLTEMLKQLFIPKLPTAVQFDVRLAVEDMFHSTPGQLQPVLDAIAITRVTAENKQLVTQFDFKVRAK